MQSELANAMDPGSHGGYRETFPIIDDPQCVQAQWESFLKINPSTNIQQVFLLFKPPAGRTHFSAGDEWMFLGNAISYWSVFFLSSTSLSRHKSTSLSAHSAPSPTLTLPLPTAPPQGAPPPQGNCSLLLFLSFLERESLQSRFCVSLVTLLFCSLQRVNPSLSPFLSALILPPFQG